MRGRGWPLGYSAVIDVMRHGRRDTTMKRVLFIVSPYTRLYDRRNIYLEKNKVFGFDVRGIEFGALG